MSRSFATLRHRIEGLSQRSRRVIGVAALLGVPVGLAWSAFWHTTRLSDYIWGPVLIVFGAATGFGALVLYTFVRDRANRDARLDERQRRLQDQAFVLAYQVLSGVVTVIMIVVGILVLGMGRVITLDATFVTGFVLCATVLLPLLPVAALAWVEPDPPSEA